MRNLYVAMMHTLKMRMITDDDNDAVADATDNCPLVSNAKQQKTDGAAEGGDEDDHIIYSFRRTIAMLSQ